MKIYKACQNDNCDAKGDGKLYSVTDKYCVKCGQPLFHVFRQCSIVLENDRDKLCSACIQKNEDVKQKNKDLAVGAIKAVPAAVVGAVNLAPKIPPALKQVQKIIKKK